VNIRRIALFLSLAVPMSAASFADTIHDAAKSGDLVKVQRLIIDGSDVNGKGVNEETPLIVASLAGQGEIANYLLQRGADIDARNTGGLSALHAAAYAGHRDIVALLLVKGADINDATNRFGAPPLHLAAEEGHLAVVELLIQHGADPTAVERNGYTALTRAGWREHWEVAFLLLANGAVCQEASKVGDWLYKECSMRATKR
jgi:ankyrin repeat protein